MAAILLPKLKTIGLNVPQIPYEKFSISDFSGGLNTHDPETSIEDNQFATLLNLYVEKDGSLTTRDPFRPYLLTSIETKTWIDPDEYAPLSVIWYDVNDVSSPVVSWNDTIAKLYYWNSSTWTAITKVLTSANPVEFLKYAINDKEDVICANGVDAPFRIESDATASDLGLAAPDIASAVNATVGSSTGRGIEVNGTYYYKTAFRYNTGTNTKFGLSVGDSNLITVTVTGASATAAKNVAFSSITLATGADRTYFYRSPANESNGPFYEVGYTTGTTFTDSTPVGEEGGAVEIDAATPPVLQYITSSSGRIFGFDAAIPNKLVWSRAGEPDMFDALNYAYLPDDGMGIGVFNKDVYVFTKDECFIIVGGNPSTNNIPKVCRKGCTSHRSIVDVGSGLVWQGIDNIFWANFNIAGADGDYPVIIGEPIKDKITAIDAANLSNSIGCYYRNRYYLSIQTGDASVNNITLVWNIEVGRALLTEGRTGGWCQVDWLAADMINENNTLWTLDSARYYLMEHDVVGVDDIYVFNDSPTLVPIPITLKGKVLHFASESADKLIGSVSMVGKSSGTTLTCLLSINNGEFTKTFNLNFGSDSAPSSTTGVYGTSTYGVAPTWTIAVDSLTTAPTVGDTVTGNTSHTTPDGSAAPTLVVSSANTTTNIIVGTEHNVGYQSSGAWGMFLADETITDDGSSTMEPSPATVASFTATATTSSPTYAGSPFVFRNVHRKVPYGAKGTNFQLAVTGLDAQDTKFSNLMIYYRFLPQPF